MLSRDDLAVSIKRRARAARDRVSAWRADHGYPETAEVPEWAEPDEQVAARYAVSDPSTSRLSGRTGLGGLLVPEPVFVFSAVRSGSTLLRMILDSHSQICAPFEMHLAMLEVQVPRPGLRKAVQTMKLDESTLADLLWDRLLALQLADSGKSIIVDKTPQTTFQWRRVAAFWPRLRPLFLVRHPLRVAESLIAARPNLPVTRHYARVNAYTDALVEARGALPGYSASYERLTAEPEQVTREICDWLGVPWEASMLAYGDQRHGGNFRRGLGDWGDKIRGGTIEAADSLPDLSEVPAQLRRATRLLGYA